MRSNDLIRDRYLHMRYVESNPTWDIEDSPWKALLVLDMLRAHGMAPRRIVEVGCGAGGVLAELRQHFPNAELFGFDIAPEAARFWELHAGKQIHFNVADFLETDTGHYDLLLLLDVIEHLSNPFNFLADARSRADHHIFHIPLDLSAVSVFRESPLLEARNKVGHIHYFTKGLALALLQECGYEVLDWRYTGAAFNAPQRTWKTRLAGLARRLAYAINKDAGVRLLGGETLIVLARTMRA
jgi:SAM-dependent methyltransferase